MLDTPDLWNHLAGYYSSSIPAAFFSAEPRAPAKSSSFVDRRSARRFPKALGRPTWATVTFNVPIVGSPFFLELLRFGGIGSKGAFSHVASDTG